MNDLTGAGLFALWLLIMSAALFIVMGADKFFARHDMRRVPEKRLFLLALLGGAPGGFLGMYAFRHKTRHRQFAVGFPALAVLQLAVYLLFRQYAA